MTAEEYRAVLQKCVETPDGVDLCVYAAGIGELFDAADLSAQTRTLDVNILGAARTVEVVAPRMVAAGSGRIVGLSSIADGAVSGEAPAYAASKAALSAYFLGLALALQPHGVTVTTMRFGFVDTKMAKSAATPMMISAEKAVDLIMETLDTRRKVVTYPRTLAALARVLRLVTAARLWKSR